MGRAQVPSDPLRSAGERSNDNRMGEWADRQYRCSCAWHLACPAPSLEARRSGSSPHPIPPIGLLGLQLIGVPGGGGGRDYIHVDPLGHDHTEQVGIRRTRMWSGVRRNGVEGMC